MSDGGIPPIEITLSVDAANAAQGVADFVKETKVQIEKGYNDACVKAQRKLDDLNRSQKVHQEVITQTGQKVEELSKKKQTASQADQANIDQEIKKLQTLIQTRQLDLVAIDAKKAKVEEQGLLSLSTNAAERQALQQVTQGRLVELSALRDQMRAIAGVRDTSATAAAQIKADLSDMTRKQTELNQVISSHEQRIMALQRQSQNASASEKDRIEQEISGLTKAIQSRGAEVYEIDAKKTKLEESAALMSATSDEERAKIQQSTQARLAEIAVIQDSNKVQAGVRDSHSQMTAEAKAEIDSLTRKQSEHNATIDADKKKIDELKAKKASASEEGKKQIDQEIGSLQRIIANRQQESLEIEAKKIKLEETLALSTASSEYERNAIQKVTSERLVENNVIRDQQKAQSAVNNTTQAGTAIVTNYLASFVGLAGIITLVRILSQTMKGQQEEMERIAQSGDKIRALQGGGFDKMASFFNEAGLSGAAEQETGKKAIEGIAKDNNLEIGTVAQTAADLAPVLGMNGIKAGSDRFSDIVGHAARFKNRGMETGSMDNLLGKMLQDNPALTGQGFNQELSNILGLTAGSSKRANALLKIYDEQQIKFEGIKFDFNDVKKVYEALEANNISPESLPNASKQFFQAMDRLVGLSPEEKEQKMEELGERGLGSLEKFFATDKPVDVRGLATAIDQLPKDQQEQAARMIGGPRNVVAALAASSWSKSYRDHSGIDFPLMPKPSHPMELAKVQKEQADLALSQSEGADAAKTDFAEAQRTEKDYIGRHPESKPWFQRGVWGATVGKLAVGTTDDNENAAIGAYGKRLLRQARLLRDIDDGKVKASPAQRKAVMDSMGELRERIDPYDAMDWFSQSETLDNLVRGGGYTAKVLDTLKEHNVSDDEFIGQEARHTYRNTDLVDDRKAAPIYDRANKIYNELTGEHTPTSPPSQSAPPTPAPAKATTQPSTPPVSINYHIRQHNYGYSYDSLGGNDGLPNLYG